MERLTKRLEDGQVVFHECHGTCGTCDGATCYCIGTMVDRLATYEDTGLEPEDIVGLKNTCDRLNGINDSLFKANQEMGKDLKEWKKTHDEGRLVVLPCKVGDSVYIPDLEKKIPVKVRVQGISISVSGRTILRFGGYPVECAWGDGCGKDWFLSCGEAEAALSNANKIPCKHGLSRHRNEIGEDEVYCELNAKRMNVSLGDCLGNCESEAALAGKGGEG